MKKVMTILLLTILFLPNYKNIYACNLIPTKSTEIENFINDNSTILTEEEKNKLVEIKGNLENFQPLTQEQCDYIRECHLKTIELKLGSEKFQEYLKLIEKKNSDREFTQEDRYRLYELEKEIKNYKNGS